MNQLNEKVESLQRELITLVQESVKIRSLQGEPLPGMPFGEEVAKALDHALTVSSDMGFVTKNLDGYIGYAEYGEGEDYVAVLGHLDIVPEGNNWKYPPYGGEIHDGKLYARGALDDKGPIFAALIGLKAIKELGLPLSKRVRVIFGTNEETGCSDSVYYMTKEKAPVAGFTPDGPFPVIHAEKGIFTFNVIKDIGCQCDSLTQLVSLKGGERANMVADYCEAEIVSGEPEKLAEACAAYAAKENVKLTASIQDDKVTIVSNGISAHGSTPELGTNAIMQMLGFLGTLQLAKAVNAWVASLNKVIGKETEGKSLGIGFADEPSGKLSLNVGIIELEDEKITLTCNVRFPVTVKFDDIMSALTKTLTAENLEVSCGGHTPPLYFPKDHPLVTKLTRIFTEQTGIKAEPLAIGGGTYAKTIPNTVAFGPEFPGKPMCAHEPNEYIEIEDLILSAKIYAQAIYELAK